MGTEEIGVSGYGHWGLVIFNALLWIGVTLVLIRPRALREKYAFSLLALFLADEYIELMGFPFTISLLSDKFMSYPTAEFLSRRAGDLWRILLHQEDTGEGLDLYHLVGGVFIFGGLVLLFFASRVLQHTQASGLPATMGPYAWVRHPQYLALILMMLGFVIQGPTLLTLLLFPVLGYLYVRLARSEERELLAKYGQAYAAYMKRTPSFIRW